MSEIDLSQDALQKLRKFIHKVDNDLWEYNERNRYLNEIRWLGHSGRLLAMIDEIERLRKKLTDCKSQFGTARKRNIEFSENEGRIIHEKHLLEKEAQWLAERLKEFCWGKGEQCCLLCKTPFKGGGGCESAQAGEWREAARKAMERANGK